MKRRSFVDHLINQADSALKTLTPGVHHAERVSPSKQAGEPELSADEKRHTAGLMRINHTGEVCAQALYQGQATTARLEDVREQMEHAADEEIDHLVWCEERLKELGAQPSLLNPIFYGLSWGIGATAGLISDKISLGFVAATESQVCKHLEEHLTSLPPQDEKSQEILKQMLIDEAEHKDLALEAGGTDFPDPVKKAMTLFSKVMTQTTYKI